jgi:anaerobic dimethyl sulfoxide reductase subunit B
MSTEYGFSFARNKCTQCFACQVACKTWRNSEFRVNWRRVHKLWSGSFPNVKLATASVSCMHCADPVCVGACPVSAIKKRTEDGIVVVDKAKCIGCKACEKACPFGSPQFGADGKMQKCDMCINEIDLSKDMPPCAETCNTKALQFGKMDTKEKIIKEKEIQKLLAL